VVENLLRHGGIAIAALIILALYGWEAHARREADPTPLSRADQAAYLSYARQMRETHYAAVGDRNRMPVFPFLLSLTYRPGMSDEEFLSLAQRLNINLSILLLALLFLVLRRFFTGFYSLALLVVVAFGVFIYRVGTVEVEPLYYFVSFCAFVLLLQMLVAPRWWLAVMAGAMTALAYLTKASMLATIPIWSVVFLAESFSRHSERGNSLPAVAGRIPSGNGKAPTQDVSTSLDMTRRLGHLVLVLVAFAAIVFPYERTSKRLYGHYFFNVNSAYYMWCDSWPAAIAFTKAFRAGEIQPENSPSLAKYWREHSMAQIAGRILRGLKTFATRSAKLVGYYKFTLLLVLTVIVLTVRNWPIARQLIAREPFVAIFCLLFFCCYVLLYAWYDTVVTDSRFILTLFLPFVFVASRFALVLAEDHSITMAWRRWRTADLLGACLICLASIDVGYNALRIFQLVG
jgi:hypothetical protein